MPPIDRDRLTQAATFIDGFAQEQQRIRDVPGMAVCIRLDGEIILSNAYGWANIADQKPLRPDHIFRIASHSKMFTSTAIMILVQQGRLRLDDHLGTYLDGLPDSISQATIRQTLNHAAGVIRDGVDSNYWQLHRSFPDPATLLDMARDIFPPNESFKYSNIGYSLLGLVIEKASKTPYNQFVRESIIDLLGLKNTGPDTNDGAPQNLVLGYTGRQYPFDRIPIPDVPTHAMASATGFYSTAEDLSRFAAAHFMGNEELLTDASKREMQRPWWEVEQSEDKYGLGFDIVKIGDRRVVGHSGGFPGHSTRTWFDPKDRLVIVVLTNQTAGPGSILAKAMFRIIDLALKETPRVEDAADIDPKTFIGRFADLWGVMDIVAFGNRLFGLTPSVDDPAAAAAELKIVDADTLLIAKTSGFGSPGETVRYMRDESGAISQITWGGGASYPIGVLRERLKEGVSAP